MARQRRQVAAICVLGLCLLASGCWDHKEINDLALVGALGLDLDLEGRPMLGVEILNPGALAVGAAGSGGRSEQIVAWMMLEPLSSYAGAMLEISRRLPRIPYLGHVPLVIFGRSVAEQGVGPFLDFLDRSDIIRRSIYISVCDTATGLLQRSFIDALPSLTLDGLIQRAKNHSYGRAVTLNEFLRRLTEPGIEPIAMHTVGRPTYDLYVAREGTRSIQAIGQEGVVARPEQDDPRAEAPERKDPRDNIQGQGLSQTEQTFIAGVAVFRGQQFVGPLDGLEGRGFLWATGGVRQAAVAVQHPGNPAGQVVLRSLGSSSKIIPRLEGGRVSSVVQIHATLRVEESTHQVDLQNREVMRTIQQAAAQAIAQEARHTLRRVQTEYRSDVYGFGVEVHRRFPRYFASVLPDWNEVFAAMDVTIEVTADVRAGGLLSRADAPK
jgi:spore germination protein KC